MRYFLQTADFFGDVHTAKFAADALALRLFDVPAGEIAHGMEPKCPTHAASTDQNSHDLSYSESHADGGSEERVAVNKKVTPCFCYVPSARRAHKKHLTHAWDFRDLCMMSQVCCSS